jgi:hypothetical protein
MTKDKTQEIKDKRQRTRIKLVTKMTHNTILIKKTFDKNYNDKYPMKYKNNNSKWIMTQDYTN